MSSLRTIPPRWQAIGLLVFCAGLALPAAPAAGDVSGTVRDQATLAPIPHALVTLQATQVRATTDSQGAFILPLRMASDLVIVGAKKGYYNASVVVDSPATGVDILLEAVPVQDNPDYALMSPISCGLCHPNQLNEWLDTPMANAGLNTWVHDTYSGTGTPGGMGGFVYLLDSAYAQDNPASECASCHQPHTWIQTPFTPLEGPQDPGYPSTAVLHGVSCDVCHKIADVNVANINYPGLFPGAATFTRPDGPPFHQVQYGVLGDVDFNLTMSMRASYQPQLVAEACGLCHQDKNDIKGNHTFTGVISEPTYIEWVESPYANTESPLYADCVDCHMPPSGETWICSLLFPALKRPPETIRSHTIRGTTPEFLENAVEMQMNASQVGATLEVDVSIINSLTGHHVPTGVTIRNMILLVEAWSEDHGAALEFTGTQRIHELGGIGDPAQGYYAGLPGKLYAKLIHDAEGNAPTFFTDAAGIVFDNRIPALQTDATHYTFAVPPAGGLVTVRARLIYRRSFRPLVDAKGWTLDGHGNPLEDITPPHFGHLMESAQQTLELSPPVVPEAIPAVSGWGMAALITLLVAGTIAVAVRPKPACDRR